MLEMTFLMSTATLDPRANLFGIQVQVWLSIDWVQFASRPIINSSTT